MVLVIVFPDTPGVQANTTGAFLLSKIRLLEIAVKPVAIGPPTCRSITQHLLF